MVRSTAARIAERPTTADRVDEPVSRAAPPRNQSTIAVVSTTSRPPPRASKVTPAELRTPRRSRCPSRSPRTGRGRPSRGGPRAARSTAGAAGRQPSRPSARAPAGAPTAPGRHRRESRPGGCRDENAGPEAGHGIREKDKDDEHVHPRDPGAADHPRLQGRPSRSGSSCSTDSSHGGARPATSSRVESNIAVKPQTKGPSTSKPGPR